MRIGWGPVRTLADDGSRPTAHDRRSTVRQPCSQRGILPAIRGREEDKKMKLGRFGFWLSWVPWLTFVLILAVRPG
jgi:hypothetical protein